MPTTTNPGTPSRAGIALGIAAFAALLWTGYEAYQLNSLSKALKTPAAPLAIVSLELAPTAAKASEIRNEWGSRRSTLVECSDPTGVTCKTVTLDAQRVLERDTRLVWAYVALGVLLTLWAAWTTKLSPVVTAAIVGLFVIGGLCDHIENWLLGITLGNPAHLPFASVAWLIPGLVSNAFDASGEYSHAVTLARLAAMSKFTFLLLGVAATLAATGGALRMIFGRKATIGEHDDRLKSFGDLITRETDGIFFDPARRSPDEPYCEVHRAADEQYVAFRAADLIGLALSGGGIRSATFNLGLLQGLHRSHLLRLFDYVATVSGGGYVGSFWSEWLVRQMHKAEARSWRRFEERPWVDETPDTDTIALPEKDLFPTGRARPHGRVHIDTDQERHLREFSGFLAPRWGFFEVEMWTAIVAMLGGLVPALLIGLSVLGVGLIVWLALTFPLASPSPLAPASVLALVTAFVLYHFERWWQNVRGESAGNAGRQSAHEQDATAQGQTRYWLVAAIAIVLVAVLQALLPSLYATGFDGAWPIVTRFSQWATEQAPQTGGLLRWWVVTGISNPGHPWIFSPRLFDFGLVCVAAALLLVLVRMKHAVWPWTRERLAAFDRVLMRVLALGVFWSGIAVLWHVSINLSSLAAAAGGAVLSGAAFAALRNWIGVALRRPAEAGVTDRLKPYLPEVLAYVTLALSAGVMGGVIIRVAGDDWLRWWIAAAIMIGFLILALFIEPDQFGLHAFYRDRISRAYAGACNLFEGKSPAERQRAEDNRGTEPQEDDDRVMSELVGRPLHLVCCAANDLSGDQVETLSRGARSAVLSKYGFSLGRHFHEWPATGAQKLGSAITASAAAFNSNMGHISMRVGPAVSFLMTMLNLRLGLWLRHPAARTVARRRWPGLLLYREMFAFTSASGRLQKDGRPTPDLSDVHLSDGAHFENLALYELIRRHCRYVLVSDCGADPAVAFDDLGNALRRIREDFGVDISLDVSPLRPGADGRSRQHIAVGTIHYSPTDRGILLYVKPSITGDEPTDVLQYRTRNAAFPHEGTSDQFYDEAQWESYRRLGLHAAECIFAFVTREGGAPHTGTADWVFAEASQQWGPTPEGLEDSVLEMTKRFSALDTELQQRAARGLLKEVFPELPHLPAEIRQAYDTSQTPAGGQTTTAPIPVDAEAALASELAFLLRVIQLMEDAWLTCRLDQWWNHPLNLGWINLFARWATSAPFRLWWPVLSPMFSPGFRNFIQHRYPVPRRHGEKEIATPPRGEVKELKDPKSSSGLAATWLQARSAQTFDWEPADTPAFTRVFYENVISLWRPEAAPVPMQVGIAAVTRRDRNVGWTSDDFFVPPSLWGAGIGWHFLKNLLLKEVDAGSRWCYVIVKLPEEGSRHQVGRDDYRSFLEQYRKIGFRELILGGKLADGPIDMALCERLKFSGKDEDTLLALDLVQWKARQ